MGGHWSDVPDFSSPASNVIFEKQPSRSCLVWSPTRGHETPKTAILTCVKVFDNLPQHAICTKQLFTGKLTLLLEHQPIFGLQHMHWHMLDHQVDAWYMVTKLINGKDTLKFK